MKYSKHIPFMSAFGDIFLLNICFNLAFCYLNGFDEGCFNSRSIFFFLYINLAWVISANIFKAYKIERQFYRKAVLFTYIKINIFFFFLFLLFFQVFSFDYYQRDEIKVLFVIFFSSLVIWKFLLYYIFYFYRKSGYNYRNVVIVGYNDKATELRDYFADNPWTGYRFKGFFTHKKSDKKDIAGTYNELENYTLNNSIDEIYILMNDINKSVYKIISSIISLHPVKIRLVPDLSNFSNMNIKLVDYDMVPVMKIQQGPLSFWHNKFIKRCCDICISIIVISSILIWLIPLMAIIDFFTGREGVFFLQQRSGLNNQPFGLFKFRTMKKNGDANIKQATANDKRITRLGKFLRKTSIDELPQFFNVLFGKMSVIGPRPHMLKHTEEYKKLVDKFMVRHTVKPGITGYAQVRGFRGEIKKIKDMKDRIKFDNFYVENWSMWFDIKIIFLTIGNLIKGDDKAY